MTSMNLIEEIYSSQSWSQSNIIEEELAREMEGIYLDRDINNQISNFVSGYISSISSNSSDLDSSGDEILPGDITSSFFLNNNHLDTFTHENTDSSLQTNSNENSEEDINKLIKQCCFKKKIKNENYKETCSICQDEYKKKNTILILPCNHAFHLKCLKPWLKKNANCPICRDNIKNHFENLKNNLIEKIEKSTNINELNKIITSRKKVINKINNHVKKITKKNKKLQTK